MTTSKEQNRAHDVVENFMQERLLTPPTKVAAIIAQSPRRSRPRRWPAQNLAAAAVLLVLALSLFVPPLARAIAAIPVLGSGYRQVLSTGGLDVAYQAGLVADLNRSVSQDGLTLTAVSAYSDRLLTTFVLKLTHEDNTWEYWQANLHSFGLQGEERGTAFASGWAGYHHYEEAEDAIYYLATKEISLPWWRRLQVAYTRYTADLEADLTLKLTFPVQKVSDRDTVRVNHAFEGGAVLRSVTFTPARTQINYSSSDRTPIWGILLSDGSELLHKDEGIWIREPNAVFPAVNQRDLTIALKGYEVPEVVTIPVEVGAEYHGLVSLRITAIEPFVDFHGAERLRIHAVSTPFQRYPHLFWQDGVYNNAGERVSGISIGGFDNEQGERELVIGVLPLPEDEDFTLEFTLMALEEVNEKVELGR